MIGNLDSRRDGVRRLLATVLLVCSACGDDRGRDDGEEHGGHALPAPGDPCALDLGFCLDDAEMLRCRDGSWQPQSCADYCQSLAPGVLASACDVVDDLTVPLLACGCTPPAGGCEPGEGLCLDQDTLRWCGQDWTWADYGCEALCLEQSMTSLGCEAIGDKATCLCTIIGTPCTDEAPLCLDDRRLSVCDGGLWTEVDCEAECGAGCEPAGVSGAACDCG